MDVTPVTTKEQGGHGLRGFEHRILTDTTVVGISSVVLSEVSGIQSNIKPYNKFKTYR